MRCVRLLTVFVASSLAAVAQAVPPLDCQSCNRPDLPDYARNFTGAADTVTFDGINYPSPYTFDGFTQLFLALNQKLPPYAYGIQSVEALRPNGRIDQVLYWEMFEPDKLQRAATKSSLSQKDYVAVGLYRFGTVNGTSTYNDTYTALSMQGCKASATADENKGEASWKIECKVLADVLTELGIPAGEHPFIAAILDTSPSKKVKLGAKVPF